MFETAAKSTRACRAQDRLHHRFEIGEREQQKLVEAVASLHIRDKLVPQKKLSFSCEFAAQPRVHYGESSSAKINRHALQQMCAVISIPSSYVRRLMRGTPWERELFAHNFNELFGKGSYKDRSGNQKKYLHRLVGPPEDLELRGYLSRNFNRQLASLPLLHSFLASCEEVGAQPTEGLASTTRFSMKCCLPHVFEPVPGEFVAFGIEWANSDFGNGLLRMSLTAMRISGGSTSVLSDVMSRVHLGSIIQDSDLEMSGETAMKEVEAHKSAIRDTVRAQLQPEPINRLLAGIKAAHEAQIPWASLKSELGRLLTSEKEQIKEMLETGIDDIIDLPPPAMTEEGEIMPTRWWASNVIGYLASKETNAEHKRDLQKTAGEILTRK